jgi:hypothetical protein
MTLLSKISTLFKKTPCYPASIGMGCAGYTRKTLKETQCRVKTFLL